MYHQNFKQIAKDNQNFRHVLHTTTLSQVVVMNLLPGKDIGEEIHEGHDQIFMIFEGKAEATVNDQVQVVNEDDLLVVPSGAKHNLRNIDDEDLKLCTIYTPPTHPDKIIHATKSEALEDGTNDTFAELHQQYLAALESSNT